MDTTASFDIYFISLQKFLLEKDDISVEDLKEEVDKIKLTDKKSPVDQAIRDQVMLQLASDSPSSEKLKSLLQLSVSAACADICSPVTPFLLFADVFNTETISFCEKIFSFMEETILTLKDTPLFGSGRNTLLRMCNDLLRRLSKSQNTVFCGRIQLFLSRLFPLDEKSGLNLMSHFNTENLTPFNRTPSADSFQRQQSNASVSRNITIDGIEVEVEEGEMKESGAPQVDYDLYVKFWSLQDFFRYPVQCYEKTKWRSFVANTEQVLTGFNSFKLDSVATKRRPTDTRFTKYLTSEKLLDLQLMDSTFRRYILVQFLILFKYLTATVKFKSAEQHMNEEQALWVRKSRDQVLQLLKETPPRDDGFLAVVDHILAREDGWNQWKNEGCPSFLRSVPDDQTFAAQTRKRRGNPLIDRSGNKVFRFANNELNRLWNICPDNYEACRSEKGLFAPTFAEYFEEANIQMDPEEKVEEQYKLVNSESWTWRSLRYISRRGDKSGVNWYGTGKPIKDFITDVMNKVKTEQVEEANGVSEAGDDASSSQPVANSDEATTAGVDGDEELDEPEEGTTGRGDSEATSQHSEEMEEAETPKNCSHRRGGTTLAGDDEQDDAEEDPEELDEEVAPCRDELQLIKDKLTPLCASVAPHCWAVGQALQFKEDELEYIRSMYPKETPDQQQGVANKLFRLWFDGNTPVPVTLAALQDALVKADLRDLFKQLAEILGIPTSH